MPRRVDPAGCGCPDCWAGAVSVPVTSATWQDIRAMLVDPAKLNNTGETFIAETAVHLQREAAFSDRQRWTFDSRTVSTSLPCGCGDPETAATLIRAVIGRPEIGGETQEIERHMCGPHGSAARGSIADEVRPDGWVVRKFSLTKIARERANA